MSEFLLGCLLTFGGVVVVAMVASVVLGIFCIVKLWKRVSNLERNNERFSRDLTEQIDGVYRDMDQRLGVINQYLNEGYADEINGKIDSRVDKLESRLAKEKEKL